MNIASLTQSEKRRVNDEIQFMRKVVYEKTQLMFDGGDENVRDKPSGADSDKLIRISHQVHHKRILSFLKAWHNKESAEVLSLDSPL